MTFNSFTIEDFKKGYIALIWDDTEATVIIKFFEELIGFKLGMGGYNYYSYGDGNKIGFDHISEGNDLGITTYARISDLIKDSTIINNSKKEENGNKSIKVQAVKTTIRSGQKIIGCCVSGKTGKTTITVGHISNRTVVAWGSGRTCEVKECLSVWFTGDYQQVEWG